MLKELQYMIRFTEEFSGSLCLKKHIVKQLHSDT